MTDDTEYVLLMTAKTGFEAEVVLGLLRAEGIPATGGSDSRWDGFASAQHAMNLSGVEIRVPAAERERAAGIVAAARDAGRELAEEDAEHEEA